MDPVSLLYLACQVTWESYYLVSIPSSRYLKRAKKGARARSHPTLKPTDEAGRMALVITRNSSCYLLLSTKQ